LAQLLRCNCFVEQMPTLTEELQESFLDALGPVVATHSACKIKPLCVDLHSPAPPRLRCYIYSLVDGGPRRPNEFKAVLRVPGQRVGQYDSFDSSDGRLPLVVGFRSDLDVFVLWDAALHPQFKNGGNVQVKDTTVLTAAALGRASQLRVLSGATELVIACQSPHLLAAISDRVAWTGGAPEDDWAISRS
jgi:hypothetical protein